MFRYRTVTICWLIASICGILFFDNPFSSLLTVTVLYFLCLCLGAYQIGFNFYLKSLNHIPNTGNLAAVTFDDGPTPHTLEVLKVLSKYNSKATFFCIGKQIEKYPEILRKIQMEGHLIGNHTYTHKMQFTFSSTKAVKSEIEKTNEAIARITGFYSNLFRPPFGVTNPKIRKALKSLKMKSIGWNRRSLDTNGLSEARILKRTAEKLKPGDIVLFHDHLSTTAQTLDKFLSITTKKGFTFDRIDHIQEAATDDIAT